MCKFTPPKNGERIRLTYLPPARNAPSEKNCYIGSEGIVEDSDEDGFYLNMGSGLLVVLADRHIKYEVMPQNKTHKFPHQDKPELDIIMVELVDTFGSKALDVHDRIVKVMESKNIPLENKDVRWMLSKMAIETNKICKL